MPIWGTKTERKQITFRGDRCKLLRKKLGMSQQELADVCEVSRTQIVNLENGVSEPSLKCLVLISLALHSSTDYLLEIDEHPGKKWSMKTHIEKEWILKENSIEELEYSDDN